MGVPATASLAMGRDFCVKREGPTKVQVVAAKDSNFELVELLVQIG